MPSYEEDYKAIETARKNAGGLLSTSGSLDASANTFRDEVMSSVRNARAERGISGLGQDYANVTKELATYGPNMEERMQGVDPARVDALRARERGEVLGRLSSISTMMSEQTADIDEIIGAGTNRLKAMATLKKAEADKAKEDADVMMKMVQIKQEEDQRQFDRIMKQRELAISASRVSADNEATVPSDQYTYAAGVAGKKWSELTPEQREALAAAPSQVAVGMTARSIIDNYINNDYKIVQEGGKVYAIKEDKGFLGTGIKKKVDKQEIGDAKTIYGSLTASKGAGSTTALDIPPGYIMVKKRASGEQGVIPEGEFNANTYERM